MDLSTLTTHAQRLGARLSENLAERSKDLGLPLSLDALSNPTAAALNLAGGLGKGMWDDPKLQTAEGERETRKLLGSKSEREREDGLRRVILLMCKHRNVLSYFPLVTNCLHSSNFVSSSALAPSAGLTTRQLVSIYIIRHATQSQDLALLAVNAYQKDLTDHNPAIRALALRTLAGMKLDTVAPLVVMSVTKAARDGNWWVRKAAAEALVSVFRLDPETHRPSLVSGPLPVLLADRSPLVVGSALEAWEAVCPNRYDLLHQQYRRYCRLLVDADGWGQLVIMRVLTRYARLHFRDPNAPGYSLDPDLDLLLRSAEPLFQSHNPATVLATGHLYCFLAPGQRMTALVEPLVRMVRSPAGDELLYITLSDIVRIVSHRPDLFASYLPNFLIFSSDTVAVKRRKLKILVMLTDQKNAGFVLKELQTYAKDEDGEFAGEAITAMGTVAIAAPSVSQEAIKVLIDVSRSKKDAVVSQAIRALRLLLRHPSHAASRPGLITRLARLLVHNRVLSPSARATTYWLVGQYGAEGDLLQSTAPDLLRTAAKGFAEESSVAKMQIVALAAKLLVLSHASSLPPHLRFYASTFKYVTTLARYDEDYAVRDRARFISGLVAAAGIGIEEAKVTLHADAFARGDDLIDTEQADVDVARPKLTVEDVRQILFDRKAGPSTDASRRREGGRLGSLVGLVQQTVLDVEALPAWSTTSSDSALREIEVAPSSAATPGIKGVMPSLRGFGSDSLANHGRSSPVRREPVVLVPTTRSHTSSPAPGPTGVGGYKDLDDFLGDEEEEEEEESEEEEEEEESGSEEEYEDEEEEEDSQAAELASPHRSRPRA